MTAGKKNYGHSPTGWSMSKAYEEGWHDGYQAGTVHMRRAYDGSTMATPGQEAYGKADKRDDAWVSSAMESPDTDEEICQHDGQEDASDCPEVEEVTGNMVRPRLGEYVVIARFPPFDDIT